MRKILIVLFVGIYFSSLSADDTGVLNLCINSSKEEYRYCKYRHYPDFTSYVSLLSKCHGVDSSGQKDKKASVSNKDIAENIKGDTKKKTAKSAKKTKKKDDGIKAVSVVGMIGGMRIIADVTSNDSAAISVEEQKKKIIKALGLNYTEIKPIDTLHVKKVDSVDAPQKAKIDSTVLIKNTIPKTKIVEKPKEIVKKKTVPGSGKKHLSRKAYESLYEQARRKIDNNYSMLKERGDSAFNIGNYAIAKFFYIQAKQVKSFEDYPEKKLKEIQDILKNTRYQKIKNKFLELVNKADGYFKKNSYVVARFYYRKAMEIRIWDKHVKKRLKEIEAKIGK